MNRYIYYFNKDNDIHDVSIVGKKGFGLLHIAKLEIDTPPGFIISSEVSQYYYKNKTLPDNFILDIKNAIINLETITNKIYGYSLYVSVRSGSVISMPGMMDTVLNVGTHDEPYDELYNCIIQILNSWNNESAILYRKINKIDDHLGTAVIIQSMVYGDLNQNSYTGVVFSRCPNTGKKEITGEFLQRARGPDIVDGRKTPKSIINLPTHLYNQIQDICHKLETYFKYVQDIEFTIQDNYIYILQTREALMTAEAQITSLIALVSEKVLSKKEALLKIEAKNLSSLLHGQISEENISEIGVGLPGSAGAISGTAVFSADKCTKDTILIKLETNSNDIKGIYNAAGMLTAHGGTTSHAVVIARSIGKPCVCGVSNMTIINNQAYINDICISEGDEITIDGSTGKVYLGKKNIKYHNTSEKNINTVINWAQRYATVRANADTLEEVEKAMQFGASGIGLLRIEHIFFDNIEIIQKVILSDKLEYLEDMYNYLLEKLKSIIEILDNKPINIRLLDPPLHEFLNDIDINKISNLLKISKEKCLDKIMKLKETNSMMGFRGCRVGIIRPEIYNTQIKVIESLNANIEIMIPFVNDPSEIDHIHTNISNIGTMIELPRAAMLADEIAKKVTFFSFGTNDLTQTVYGLSRDDCSDIIQSYIETGIFLSDPFVEIDTKAVGELMKIAIQKGKSVNKNLSISICGEHAGNLKSIEFFSTLDLNYISCSPYRVFPALVKMAQCKILNSFDFENK